MRQIIYDVAMTVDNFICREDGSIGGFVEDGGHVTDYFIRLEGYSTVLMGRKTYEFGYQYGMKPGDRAYPHMDHYIFSDSLQLESDQLNIVNRDRRDIVRRLKEEEGGDIYLCGGGKLSGALLQEKLIDKLIIKLNPVAFGRGVRLFGGIESGFTLKLTECKPYENGVVLLSYDVAYD